MKKTKLLTISLLAAIVSTSLAGYGFSATPVSNSRPPAMRPGNNTPHRPTPTPPPAHNYYNIRYRPLSSYRPIQSPTIIMTTLRARPDTSRTYPSRDRFYNNGPTRMGRIIQQHAGNSAVRASIFGSLRYNDHSYGQIEVETTRGNRYELVYVRTNSNVFVPVEVSRGTAELGLQNRDQLLRNRNRYRNNTETVYLRTSNGRMIPIEVATNTYSFGR